MHVAAATASKRTAKCRRSRRRGARLARVGHIEERMGRIAPGNALLEASSFWGPPGRVDLLVQVGDAG